MQFYKAASFIIIPINYALFLQENTDKTRFINSAVVHNFSKTLVAQRIGLWLFFVIKKICLIENISLSSWSIKSGYIGVFGCA